MGMFGLAIFVANSRQDISWIGYYHNTGSRAIYENNLWNNPSHQRYIHLPRYHHHVIHLDFGSTPAVTKTKARISRYIIFRRCDAKISVDEREDADADVDSNESKPRYK